MSLDVSLMGPKEESECRCPNCDNIHARTAQTEYYWANITHNLNQMADKAGIYQYLWRPDEIGITRAGQLVEPLREGLRRLRSDPAYFKQFNSENGWGNYKDLVEFVSNYLAACEEYTEAEIEISR